MHPTRSNDDEDGAKKNQSMTYIQTHYAKLNQFNCTQFQSISRRMDLFDLKNLIQFSAVKMYLLTHLTFNLLLCKTSSFHVCALHFVWSVSCYC